MQSTKSTRIIRASKEAIYKALTDPEALPLWLAPGNMTAKVHNFDLRVGGGYAMSLYYPDNEKGAPGKTTATEDRFTARFVELHPPVNIVQLINFDSTDAKFSGEMRMEITLETRDGSTAVTFLFDNIPPGITPEDNETGTESSLEKLAQFVE